MKNYLLFIGEKFYPKGGFEDFVADYDSIDDANLFLAAYLKTEEAMASGKFWHIFSLKDARIITTCDPYCKP